MNRARRESADAWTRGYLDEETGEFVLPATRERGRPKPTETARPVPHDGLRDFVQAERANAAALSRRYGIFAVRCAVWCVIAFVASHWVGGAALWAVSIVLGGAALWYWDRARVESRIASVG